jgi:hypothetical protein
MLQTIKSVALASAIFATAQGGVIQVSLNPPTNTSATILESFISYSIEFSSFPDFAGNLSAPNSFSNNLLTNIAHLTGEKPSIRVGGNTQDYALYNASLRTATNGTINPSRSPDYPTTLSIGPSFFESYLTWPGTRYTHGFNLGLGGNSTAGWETLLATVPLACNALRGRLVAWEYGNEPDLYSTSAQGPVRPPGWNESAYVSQWLNGTRHIRSQLAKYCPDMLADGSYGYYAPSFAGTDNHLKPITTFAKGLDGDGDIKVISSHKYLTSPLTFARLSADWSSYIGGATQPGITLQNTLLNHTSTSHSLSLQTALAAALSYTNLPFILGETNSLYNEGAPGLSNAFGAALWVLDFNLLSAARGIGRVHMHQGTDYRYAAWQPVATSKTTVGTKPPYYGQVAAGAVLGRKSTGGERSVVELEVGDESESAYAAYDGGTLRRLAVLNMRAYNYTLGGVLNNPPNPVVRPSRNYTFSVPAREGDWAIVRRLTANGSDAISGISWDGTSNNWELARGLPVRLWNVTVGERVRVKGGMVSVGVADSSATVLEFDTIDIE